MAEFIVSLSVQRIADLLIHEAVSLHEVKEEVEQLQAELRRMFCFLKDADFKQEQDEHVHNWVAEIRSLANDAEDVIETFILKAAGEGGLRRIIKKFTSIFSEGVHLHETRMHIKAIQTKIGDISNNMQTYGIKFVAEEEGSDSMQQRSGRSFLRAEEELVISLEDSTRNLMAQLMTEEDRRIVSIVGMGGLGKTTLAKKVYDQMDVKRHFECCAWVFLSQKYAVKDVLSGILEKFGSSATEMREEELVDRVYNVLKEKRYLVVLDDIRRSKDWDSLKLAFPNGKKGSKVLLTTRNKEVALYAVDPSSSSPLEPPILTDEEGWELLCRKAFPREIVHERSSYLPGFEKLGKEMVRNCGGLPLAIALLGGLLAKKKSLDEWEAVQRNIIVYSNKHSVGMNEILALSYRDLPFYLKPCFLYLSHFPADWEIPKKKLIRLWIAEGFVPSLKGECEEKIEELAEQYLQELISRSLIQVSQRDHTGREVKTCHIHDLVRELCVKKAQEENFLGIIHMQDNHLAEDSSSLLLPSATSKRRRIALHPCSDPSTYTERYGPLVQGHEYLRSLSLLAKDNHLEMSLRITEEISLHNSFRLLRVLVLYSPKASDSLLIPSEIGNLIHLRYLRLKCYARDLTLPQSIGDLRNLRTLDVHCYGFTSLPNVMYKLQRLRHLVLTSLTARNQSYRIDTLRNLETLKLISAENIIRNDTLQKLTNLHNLGIEFNSSEEAEIFLRSPIVRSGRIRSLHMCIQNSSYPDLEPLSHCDQLSKLSLEGEIPEEMLSLRHNLEYLPANIAKLTLGNSNLRQDPMAMLEKLPNLKFLSLEWYSYVGTEMTCSALGFPQLEFLTLDHMANLEVWKIEEGAMSNLKSLQMHDLPELRELPEGLRSLTSLQELKLIAMTRSFQKRIRGIEGIEGEDFYKVQHIPSVLVSS